MKVDWIQIKPSFFDFFLYQENLLIGLGFFIVGLVMTYGITYPIDESRSKVKKCIRNTILISMLFAVTVMLIFSLVEMKNTEHPLNAKYIEAYYDYVEDEKEKKIIELENIENVRISQTKSKSFRFFKEETNEDQLRIAFMAIFEKDGVVKTKKFNDVLVVLDNDIEKTHIEFYDLDEVENKLVGDEFGHILYIKSADAGQINLKNLFSK